jgi:DNA helicase-2/ATP-dependent DNA helicase PcrA
MTSQGLLRLTDQQEVAVGVDGGAYLLMAPPGSGKTEILVRRVIRLLENSRGQTFRILALTFTTKAAESLRSRVLASLADDGWRLTAGTFHAFCLDVLQHYGEPVGVAANATVLAALDERLDALNRAMESEGYLAPGAVLGADAGRTLLAAIDQLRGQLVPPLAAAATPVPPLGIPAARLYQAYDATLTQLNAIDFPGMLERCYRLLVESHWTLEMLRRTYRYVLVDEAQDTNYAQFELLRTLVDRDHANVFLVADRNQAIYGFAGSDTRFLDEFVSEFGATKLPLTSNFRSAGRIVAIANRLAKHLPGGGTGLAMTSVAGAEGHVDAFAFPDEAAEARAISEWVSRLLREGLDPNWAHAGEDLRVSAEQVCILGRTRFALDPVRARLEELAIPNVFRTGEGGLFDSELGQALYFLLRAVCKPLDRPATRKAADRLSPIVGNPPDGADIGDLISLMEGDRENRLRPIASELRLLLDGAGSVAALISAGTKVELPYGDAALDAAWVSDRAAFAGFWRMFEIRTRDGERTLQGFVQWLSIAQRGAIDEPGVRLLTVHAAKGLEFRAVAVIGLNEGTFPYYKALQSESELNEERRSVYVAITRAARVLLLSRPVRRETRSGPRVQAESRFLAEMDIKMGAGSG